MRNDEQLNLGQLIFALQNCDPSLPVFYDFCRFVPIQPQSYRGYYEQLAFGYVEAIHAEKTIVKDVLNWCLDADGKTFSGYKGGSYVMGKGTSIWVSNWGECTDTIITEVRQCESKVILATSLDGSW